MYAVLDLGSNSFHLIVAELRESRIELVKKFSKKVQLAEGLEREGKIEKSVRERAVKALQEIQSELAAYPLTKLCVVGTNAFRQAKNANKLLEDAASIGFSIQVISGLQEATYIYLGAQAFLPKSTQPRLIFDIGGGSTEFAIGIGDKPRFVDSLPLGCVTGRLVGQDGSEKITRKTLAKLRRKAHQVLDSQLNPQFYEIDWADCYASSGTAKMLSAVLRENQLTDGTITETALQELETRAVELGTVSALEKLSGLKSNRHNVFSSGLAIMQSIMDHLGIDHVDYSDFALREGVLLSMVREGDKFSLVTSP